MSARRQLLDGLRMWREAGVLDAAEIHIASHLAARAGEQRANVVLGLALAVAAPRSGHVALDPDNVRESAMRDAERIDDEARNAVAGLPWPVDTEAWLSEIADSPLTPEILRVERGLVYLRRFHDLECSVAERLISLASQSTTDAIAADALSEAMGLDDGQRDAVRVCLASRLGVLVGGPGTGKTRTVATILAALLSGEGPTPRVALAAPTGKAAARMGESIAAAAALLDSSDPELADSMRQLKPSTVHRLLGVRYGTAAFRRDASDPLHHDVVVIDEASMMSLPLTASLLDALGGTTRLILVGDPGQLASVEAGSVLADLVAADGPTASCVAELTANHRFDAGSAIAELAAAVRDGDVEGRSSHGDRDLGGRAPRFGSGALRPSTWAGWRRPMERDGGVLARRCSPVLRLRGTSGDGDPERRAAPTLQRRYRSRHRPGRRARGRPARGRWGPVRSPGASRPSRDRARPHHPQEPRIRVRPGRRGVALGRLAARHPRAALHGDHPRAILGDPHRVDGRREVGGVATDPTGERTPRSTQRLVDALDVRTRTRPDRHHRDRLR